MKNMKIWINGLAHFSAWQSAALYLLFVLSLFSIAGMDMAILLLLIASIVHCTKHPDPVLTRQLPVWVWAAFVAYPVVLFLTQLLGEGESIGEIIYDMRGQLRVWLPLLLLIPLRVVRLERLMGVYAGFFALLGVYSLLQFLFGEAWDFVGDAVVPIGPGGRYHAMGTFSHHLTLGGIALMGAPIFVALAMNGKGYSKWGVGVFGTMVTLLCTMARSAWLGAFCGLLLLAWRLSLRWRLAIGSAALLMLIILTMLLRAGSLENMPVTRFLHPYIVQTPLKSFWLRIGASSEQSKERVALWTVAWHGFAEKPLLGNGITGAHYNAYRNQYGHPMDQRMDWHGRNPQAHNMYLKLAFGAGVVGLGAYLWVWGVVLVWNMRWLWRMKHALVMFEFKLLLGCTSALIGAVVFGWFQEHFFDSEVLISILLWMGISLHCGLRLQAQWMESKASSQP